MKAARQLKNSRRPFGCNNVIYAAACCVVGVAFSDSAHADIDLGSSWVANARGGYDSFHDFDNTGTLTPTVRAGGNTWLRVDVPQQYYTGLATEIGDNPAVTVASIAANPVVQFDLDMSDWTWPTAVSPSAYIQVGYYSNDASNGNTYFSYAEPTTTGIFGGITHIVADLNTLHPGSTPPPIDMAASSRPAATYFNLVINIDPAFGTGGAYTPDSQHFFIDNVKLTPEIVYGSADWTSNGSGSWNTYDASSWSTAIPSGNDLSATFGNFGGAITSPTAVNVNTPVTVGTINFDNTNSYTLSGSPITLNTATPPTHGVLTAINVLSGSHTINNQVVIGSNGDPTSFNVVQASSTLTIPNLSGQFYTFQKDGAGELIVNRATNVTMNINGGTVQIKPDGTGAGVSAVYFLGITAGAKLDLTNNGMIYDYTGATPQDDVRNQLSQGFAGGSWTGNGITSSTAAAVTGIHRTGIGYVDTAEPGVADAVTNFSDQTLDATTILMRYTLMGDTNLDQTVDSNDFAQLAANYGMTGAHWFDGDFNYDGVVNALDFNLLATNYGMSLPASSLPLAALVPEPGFLSLLGVAGLFVRRRSR